VVAPPGIEPGSNV